MIRVVSGLLLQFNEQTLAYQIFMAKRNAKSLRPALWELPGGKLEHGEYPEQAIVREWKEETNLEVVPAELLDVAVLRLDQIFVIELWAITLRPDTSASSFTLPVHDESRWVDPMFAMRHMPCSPGFYMQYLPMMRFVRQQETRKLHEIERRKM